MISDPLQPPAPLPPSNNSDFLGQLHGKRKKDIYVILSRDGSTVLKDPGLDRPWSSPNKKLAEHHAKQMGGVAVDLITAIESITRHSKNLPPSMQQSPPPGFKS